MGLEKDCLQRWHPGGLGEAGEGWGRKGGSGRSWAGDTGVLLPLWGSSPHPWVLEKLCGSARLAAVALGNLGSGVKRLCAALAAQSVRTVQKRVWSVEAYSR